MMYIEMWGLARGCEDCGLVVSGRIQVKRLKK